MAMVVTFACFTYGKVTDLFLKFQGRVVTIAYLKHAIVTILKTGSPMEETRHQRAWYESYGALPLQDQPLTLVLSLATLEKDLRAAGQL
jgi:hypothetical protein